MSAFPKSLANYCEADSELGRNGDHGIEWNTDSSELVLGSVVNLRSTHPEHLSVKVVELGLAGPRRLGGKSLLVFCGRTRWVVLESREAEASIHAGVADSITAGEELRVVLHQAFETGRALESCLGGISVLRVNEFG